MQSSNGGDENGARGKRVGFALLAAVAAGLLALLLWSRDAPREPAAPPVTPAAPTPPGAADAPAVRPPRPAPVAADAGREVPAPEPRAGGAAASARDATTGRERSGDSGPRCAEASVRRYGSGRLAGGACCRQPDLQGEVTCGDDCDAGAPTAALWCGCAENQPRCFLEERHCFQTDDCQLVARPVAPGG